MTDFDKATSGPDDGSCAHARIQSRQLALIQALQADNRRLRRQIDLYRDRQVKLGDQFSTKEAILSELREEVQALRDRLSRRWWRRMKIGGAASSEPEIGHARLRSQEFPPDPSSDESESAEAALIAASGYFDSATYAGRFEAADQGLDPVSHYLRVGERAGLPPSATFDPVEYAAANPDVAAGGGNLLVHYLRYGRAEGRALHTSAEELPGSGEEGDAILIAASGYFDAATYAGLREAAEQGLEPILHYLRVGEAAGLTPSADFNPSAYAAANPDVAAGGGNLLVHYLRYGRAEGREPRPPAGEGSDFGEEGDAILIAASGYFDAASYAGRCEAAEQGLEPILHYLRTGEAAGLAPCVRFDPAAYAAANPDVSDGGGNMLVHYLRYGREEGRKLPITAGVECPPLPQTPRRKVVLVLFHEVTRTGAPILGYNIVLELKQSYQVVCLLKRGGELEAAVRKAADATISLPDDFFPFDIDCEMIIDKINKQYQPEYAIANSVETRCFVPALEKRDVPVVALVHEFATYDWLPLGTLENLYKTASKIIFPAQMVAESSLVHYPALAVRPYEVIPQGRSVIPFGHPDLLEKSRPSESEKAIFNRFDIYDTLVVIGLGKITPRKGVEFFVSAASYVARHKQRQKYHFAWVGSCNPEDIWYLKFLQEQVARSNVGDIFSFYEEVDDLSHIYSRADIYFLSSRLDPLPNVAIDAAEEGIPIVCFDRASGIAEQLARDPTLSQLVVPYLDAEAAGREIIALADSTRRAELKVSTKAWANTTFSMQGYVKKLDALALKAIQEREKVFAEANTIIAQDGFNANLFLGHIARSDERDRALRQYLASSSRIISKAHASAGLLVRRPLEGFNPLVYATQNPHYSDEVALDPLSHYLELGRPSGPWIREVITDLTEAPINNNELRVCVHGHFYYPEFSKDLLLRFAEKSHFDFFLTTTSEEKAKSIDEMIPGNLRPRAEVRVVPNAGRDIGPLLTDLGPRIEAYDILLHVHGKRTPHRSPEIGERWRRYLWDNLVGVDGRMADVIIGAFNRDPGLGLVSPSDPYLNGWNQNLTLAEQLAIKMGLRSDLPIHFDFPQGSMFWVRPQALKALFDLKLKWQDYPDEPIPEDGTILHAIERLLPFIVADAGYSYAVTYRSSSLR